MVSGSRRTIVLGSLSLLLGASVAATGETLQASPSQRPVTPAGALIRDLTTLEPAVAPLPVSFVRSPDSLGDDGGGRYLVAVNSGFGVQFSAATNQAQQSLSVIDLGLEPPAVIQTVYFPTPQSANVGAVFGPVRSDDGAWPLFVSGGHQDRIWVFSFRPGRRSPLSPASPGPDTEVTAPAIDVSALASPSTGPPDGAKRQPAYPAGLAISPDGGTLFTANNLGDSLGIVTASAGTLLVTRVPLNLPGERFNLYPYGVIALPDAKGRGVAKVYVSLWGAGAVAVLKPAEPRRTVRHIPVARHPTAMILNRAGTRLYVANSNADSVSVIDTSRDVEIERINVRLVENALIGASPEDLALDATGHRLFVADAHANAVAIVALGEASRGVPHPEATTEDEDGPTVSRVLGFLPTGAYPSAVAVIGNLLVVGNGKGTGFANSSMTVDGSGHAPNAPNYRFPATTTNLRGQYIVSLTSGNFSAVPLPDEVGLAAASRKVMCANGLLPPGDTRLLSNPPPISHVIYVIRENRTYDQVFGDLEHAGDGSPADGAPDLAIFGASMAARTFAGPPQSITPNARALALRFGLLDRFFVNADASPDGHNWSTAAFSSDYVDKAFRWGYSGRGRSYDYEGFNRLPGYGVPGDLPEQLGRPVDSGDVAEYYKRYVPYLHGDRDVAEPETLYLWDAAARAGLTYRNYGEFVGTVTAADVEAVNLGCVKAYPDTSPVLAAFATKRSLEGRVAPGFPNYDLHIPDAMTVASYRAACADPGMDAVIKNTNADPAFRGTSRLGAWLDEFEHHVAEREAGRGDSLPALSIVRLPSDHTAGLTPGMPTPQFMVADNDYALGRLVEAVSTSPYWLDTAIFVVEDDAQDGPDHVDAHRSPALVISAYNRPGALVHEYHTTVSLIRTIELLLGLAPMNQLDASAAPIDLFQPEPDPTPYRAILPDVAPGNLLTPYPADEVTAYWVERTRAQDLAHADMADPGTLNRIIWFSVRGDRSAMPAVASLPAFDLMTTGIVDEDDEDEERSWELEVVDAARRELIARLIQRQ